MRNREHSSPRDGGGLSCGRRGAGRVSVGPKEGSRALPTSVHRMRHGQARASVLGVEWRTGTPVRCKETLGS